MRHAPIRLLLVGALLAGACGREPPSSSEPADVITIDTVVVTGPPPADTTAPDSAARQAGAPAPAIQIPATPIDRVRADIARLTERVETLTRANDSLRAVVSQTLVAAPARTAPDSAAQADSTVSGQALLDKARTGARHYAPRVFWAIVVVILTFWAVAAAVYIIERLSERNAQRRLLYKRIVPIARIVFWTISIFFIVRVVFAVDARGLLTAMAAVGVAIGFAAQDILKNIFGGLVIVFDQPFQVGDKIQVGGSYGEVVSIGLRSTRIVTPDDSLVSVPNAQIVDDQVSNANSGALDCQVVIDLYLPGWVDEAAARRIAYQATASSKYVFLKKPIVVLVKDEYKDTFVTHLKVKAYVLDTRHEFTFMSEVTERARAEFRRQGLLAPWHGAHAWVNLSAETGNGDAMPASVRARGDTT